jgi:REP-associated tyrosine transposase
MPTEILVVDANDAFATMLQQALQDQGDFKVTVATAAADAVEQAAAQRFDLAIVDMGLPDVSGADAVRALRAIRPSLAIVAIPLDGDPSDPELQALDLQGFLSKPFFLPTLGEVIAEALAQPVGGVAPQRPAPAERPAAPEASPAAPPVAEEALAPAELPAWLADEAHAAEHLAIAMHGGPAEAGVLVRESTVLARFGDFAAEDFDALTGPILANAAGTRRAAPGAFMRFVKLPASGRDCLLYVTPAAPGLELALAFHGEYPISKVRGQARGLAEALFAAPGKPALEYQARPARPAPAPATAPLRVETQSAAPGLDWATSPGPEPPPGFAAAVAREFIVDTGLELPAGADRPGLARTPHALYNLVYSVVWTPKFPKTRLVGNIAGMLDEWIRHIALSYDWRVEQVQVRPDCLVVVVNCPPETAPERLVTTLKRLTSERAFAEFPNLAADHPGGDFWAPGYLLQGGAQALTPQQIEDFLAYTRREQGLRR